MSDREANSLGRILALVLRHAPEKFNVDMDINGWVNTRELSRPSETNDDTIIGFVDGTLRPSPTPMKKDAIKLRTV